MELANSKKEGFAINTSVEVKIESFHTNKIEIHSSSVEDNFDDYGITFSVTVFPDGVAKQTEGWIAIRPVVKENKGYFILDNTFSSLIVSVIDVDGHSRFPQSFEIDYEQGIRDLETPWMSEVCYERSFILSRADELLPEDVLTLRCDMFLTWSGMSPIYRQPDMSDWPLNDFINSVPQTACFKNDAETEDPKKPFIEFDFTSQKITSTEFRSSFSYDEVFSSETKDDDTDIMDHTWIFDVRSDRFLLSLDERRDNVGSRLLKASSLIRDCMQVPSRGQHENRIELPWVDSETFTAVLLFLAIKALLKFPIRVLVKIYKFSNFFQMEELQRRCAEYLIEGTGPEIDLNGDMIEFEELEKIANVHSDDYLSELLESRRHEKLRRHSLPFRMDRTAYSDCYI